MEVVSISKFNFFSCLLFLLTSITVKADLDVTFSHDRGYYDSSFTLVLESSDPNATIIYTTDGTTPTISQGSTYGGSINVSSTTVVKAFAYTATETGRVGSNSFIYLTEVLNQPALVPGFPYATGFSSSIMNDATYGPQMEAALLSIPAMSLSLDLTDYDFIYNNKSIPVQGHIEYFDPNNPNETYDRPTGVSTYGNVTFSNIYSNKRNYRLRFKNEFGASKFKYKIFGDDAANEFDVIDLRCGGQQTFDRNGVQNLHEQILKDWQRQMSGNAVRGKFSHLYINGVYWGVYNVCERRENSFGETYYGGDKDDYNTIKGTCCGWDPEATDGTMDSYDFMIAEAGNYPAIEQYLDVDHFIDWFMLCNYGPHGDWTHWNTYAFDNPTANIPFKFFLWDPEPSFKNASYFTDSLANSRFYQHIWEPLKAHEDFRVRYGDHAQCNCIEADGPINPNNAEAYYDMTFQRYKLAYLAEAARWSYKSIYIDFLEYRDDLLNTGWFFNRSSDMIDAYKENDIYPDLDAVTFSQYGGSLNNGGSFSLNNPNSSGSIYYTIDRTDPRAPGGAIGNSAQTYNGSIGLQTGVYEVRARVKQNNEWSAMCPRKFYVDQNYSGLVINEIHYNPADSIFYNPAINTNDTVSGKNFEFVELKNTGSQDIYLEDLSFNKGISIKFGYNVVVPPGGFVVLAEDAFWFEQKYGFAPDAIYRGKLDNGGESLMLQDPFNNEIDSIRYDDNAPWDTTPDAGTFSLALIDASADNNDPANWSTQNIPVTPREENLFCLPIATSGITIDVSCNGDPSGSVVITVNGGTAPFDYLWSNGMTGSAITDLSAGIYQLMITDAFNCESTDTFTINEPATPLMLSEVHANESFEGENDGVINLAVTGGTSPYSYSWSNGATNQDVNNLAPGNYTVDVTDANNCIETLSVTIEAGQVVCSVPNTIAADNIQNTSATLSWSNDVNASTYEVEYRETGSFNWISFSSTYAFAIMNNLVACTDYEIRIRTNCSSGQNTVYSSVYNFTTDGCAMACAPISGLFSQNITTSSAFLVWDIVPNATYTLYYRAIGNPSWFTYPSTFSLAILFGLPSCTDFEWYVEVNCLDGNISTASPTNFFSTTGAACKSSLVESTEDLHLLIYPNPANDYLNIQLKTIDTDARLEIFNLQGQVLISQKVNAGQSYVQIDIQQLSAGSYLLRSTDTVQPFVKQ